MIITEVESYMHGATLSAIEASLPWETITLVPSSETEAEGLISVGDVTLSIKVSSLGNGARARVNVRLTGPLKDFEEAAPGLVRRAESEPWLENVVVNLITRECFLSCVGEMPHMAALLANVQEWLVLHLEELAGLLGTNLSPSSSEDDNELTYLLSN